MASPVLHESKHIVKRIAIGVATGVSGAVIIYFLGFNRGGREVSEIEMGKNTTKAWKTYVMFENKASVEYDSNLARGQRGIGTYYTKPVSRDSVLKEFSRQDSLTAINFLNAITELKETKDVDKEFTMLLDSRMVYAREQMNHGAEYKKKFRNIIIDSTISDADKIEELKEMNVVNTGKMDNIMERMCRSLEDIAASLSKKYDQAKFSITEFRFYPYYLGLKKKKADPSMPPPVAPPAPDKKDPTLPK